MIKNSAQNKKKNPLTFVTNRESLHVVKLVGSFCH